MKSKFNFMQQVCDMTELKPAQLAKKLGWSLQKMSYYTTRAKLPGATDIKRTIRVSKLSKEEAWELLGNLLPTSLRD